MTEKDRYYLDNNIRFRPIALIDGIYRKIETSALVGKCRYKMHPGYLDVGTMNAHKCVEKECRYFYKLEEYPYWKKDNEKKRKKNMKKLLAKAKTEAEYLTALKSIVQSIANELSFPMVIEEVKRKSTNIFLIRYVSDKHYNDYKDYAKLTHKLQNDIGGAYRLEHVKLNGKYKTME